MADKLRPHEEIDTILIKVASRCNINCTYCYVYQMGDTNYMRLEKFMSASVMDGLLRCLEELVSAQSKPFSVVLHGGEPLLLGAERLDRLLKYIRQILPVNYPMSMQTNGILINEKILASCVRYHVSIAVSIDGPASVHDQMRVGFNQEGTFDLVMRGINLLKSHSQAAFLHAGLLAVVDPLSDPTEVYEFFKSLGAPSVDFLYKDGNHDRMPLGKRAYHTTEYGEWTSRLLDVYLADPDPLPIRVLDDMMKVILGGTVSKEGLGVTDFGILIIDTDGTLMKNDTLKSAYDGADRFSSSANVVDAKFIEFLKSEDFQNYRQMQRPSSEECLRCPYLSLCGGGMILHRWSRSNQFANTSVYCRDQQYLIEHIYEVLDDLMV